MRNNAWGRPPKNNIWGDLQALALWIFIVGVVGYLLFPDFFHNVYDQLTVSTETTQELGEITLPTTTTTDTSDTTTLPSVYDTLYNGESEISDGYWAIFVADSKFQQLSLTVDNYAFVLKVINGDTGAEVKNTLLLAANGSIHKYLVSDEVYDILYNLNKINIRSGEI